MMESEMENVGNTENSTACQIHSNQKKEQRLLARLKQNEQEEDDHHEETTHQKNSLKIIVLVVITFLFFLVELVFGLLNRSVALLADSYHMLSDVMALCIALVCLKISRMKSKKNGFGWVRAEVFGALVNGVFLLSICFTITLESVGRIINPKKMANPTHVLIVGVIGLLINVVGISLFHGAHGHSHGGSGHGHGHSHGHSHNHSKKEAADSAENEELCEHDNIEESLMKTRPVRSMSHLSSACSHNHLALRLIMNENENSDEYDSDNGEDAAQLANKKKEEQENLNMKGVFLHIVSDAIGSVFVIATAAAALFFANFFGDALNYFDPGLSLVLVLLISYSAYRLVKETADIILGRPPQFINNEALKKDMTKVQGVANVQEITVWTLVANRHLATAQVEFCNAAAYEEAVPKIRRLFHTIGIHSLTLQPSFSQTGCGSQGESTNSIHE